MRNASTLFPAESGLQKPSIRVISSNTKKQCLLSSYSSLRQTYFCYARKYTYMCADGQTDTHILHIRTTFLKLTLSTPHSNLEKRKERRRKAFSAILAASSWLAGWLLKRMLASLRREEKKNFEIVRTSEKNMRSVRLAKE